MLDMNGYVGEAPGANFFMEKNGVLYTPSLGHILPGITRQTVLNICRELDIPVIERNINLKSSKAQTVHSFVERQQKLPALNLSMPNLSRKIGRIVLV